MCGIYGYVGKNNAFKEVLNGLKLLQYRGYDSCGIAYFNHGFKLTKAIGTLDKLSAPNIENHIAFGHTRWATNGKVNLKNTHPHVSYDGKLLVVHNGIITNADEIKADLQRVNVKFSSDTDSEIIVNFLAATTGDFEDNLKNIYHIFKGSFALIIGDEKGDLYLLKQFCPLNLLKSEDGIYISSDVGSLKNGELYSLNDGDIIKVSNGKIVVIAGKINFVAHFSKIKQLELNNYPHYMIKEIFDTPQAIFDCYNYLKQQPIGKMFKGYKKLTFLGCGTAYHSCLMGQQLLKDRFFCQTFLASNYIINKRIEKNHLHIIVSQSGETADCIKIAREIQKFHGKILVITNEPFSTITHFADFKLVTQAKKELAVASTKTYCAQVFTFAYIKHILQNKNFALDVYKLKERLNKYIKSLCSSRELNALTESLNTDKMILIARDIDYFTMLEASLKIREIDYIFTIPMLSSELKHGTLSLIDADTKVVSLNTNVDKTILNNAINEIKSRNGKVIEMEKYVDLKGVDDSFKPIFAIIPFQILSYKLAILKGLNPDMPRNLAKSVTVE